MGLVPMWWASDSTPTGPSVSFFVHLLFQRVLKCMITSRNECLFLSSLLILDGLTTNPSAPSPQVLG